MRSVKYKQINLIVLSLISSPPPSDLTQCWRSHAVRPWCKLGMWPEIYDLICSFLIFFFHFLFTHLLFFPFLYYVLLFQGIPFLSFVLLITHSISSLKPPSCSCPASPLTPQRPPAFITMATAQPVFYVVMVTEVEAQAIHNKV